MTDTETLDRLYLEWSQFTTARTSLEIALIKALERAGDDLRAEFGGRAYERNFSYINEALAKAHSTDYRMDGSQRWQP
jgi:hypothetical protein